MLEQIETNIEFSQWKSEEKKINEEAQLWENEKWEKSRKLFQLNNLSSSCSREAWRGRCTHIYIHHT